MSEPRLPIVLTLGALAMAAACSRSDSGGSTPTTPSGSLTITIAAGAVSPKTLTVSAGSQVTFVNNDAITHQMFSDPHPEHADCPALNQVGFLSPGQNRQTGNLTSIRTCGFHDHDQPSNPSLQGSILIR